MSSITPVEVFCCYARKDQVLMQNLKTHLISLERQKLIRIWSDVDINAGENWENEIEKHLNTAEIILLLISPDFIASEYCYSKEMTRAIERHKQNEARVIPIILRPTHWKATPFATIQGLPKEAKPITKWDTEDDAFYDIVENIENTAIEQQETRIELLAEEIERTLSNENYVKALPLCDKLINLMPDHAPAYMKKAQILFQLKLFEEAMKCYEIAIVIDPSEMNHLQMGLCLLELQQYEKAQKIFEKFILVWDSDSSHKVRKDIDPYFYHGYGRTLIFLYKLEEALKYIDQAIETIHPNIDSKFYQDKGLVHQRLSEKAYKMAQKGMTTREKKHDRDAFSTTVNDKNSTHVSKQRLPKGQRTSDKSYYQPILKILVNYGGSARVSELLPKVEEFMRPLLKSVDYEAVSSDAGTPRWRNTAQWARNSMVREGLLKPTSRIGVWEITEKGRAYLEERSHETVLFQPSILASEQ